MRVLTGMITLAILACGLWAFAGDNFAAGTWRLNAAKSRLNGPVPAMVHDGILTIPAGIYTGGSAPRPAPQAGARSVFKFDLSPDGRTLTVTRPTDGPGVKMVFDRQ